MDRLDELEEKARASGQPPALVARVLQASRALVIESVLNGPRDSEDGAFVCGLGRCALEELFARLATPACDTAMSKAALAHLLSLWDANRSAGAGLVAALFDTLALVDNRLAGNDPLARAFLQCRQEIMAQAIDEAAETLVASTEEVDTQARSLAAVRGRMRELLALPETGPVPDGEPRMDASAVTRAVFDAMPRWRDAAVVACMANRHVALITAVVEAREGRPWSALSVESVRRALTALTALAASAPAGALPWSLPLSPHAFSTFREGRVVLHRDANPLGLAWMEVLRDRGLVRAEPVCVRTFVGHPDFRRDGKLVQAQGALCGCRVDGHFLPIDVWVANLYADGVVKHQWSLSERLKSVVVASIEGREPGASRRLHAVWTNGGDAPSSS